MDIRDNRPRPGNVTNLLAPYVQRHEHENNGRRDGSHNAVRGLVSRRSDPAVGIEREEEAEH